MKCQQNLATILEIHRVLLGGISNYPERFYRQQYSPFATQVHRLNHPLFFLRNRIGFLSRVIQ